MAHQLGRLHQRLWRAWLQLLLSLHPAQAAHEGASWKALHHIPSVLLVPTQVARESAAAALLRASAAHVSSPEQGLQPASASARRLGQLPGCPAALLSAAAAAALLCAAAAEVAVEGGGSHHQQEGHTGQDSAAALAMPGLAANPARAPQVAVALPQPPLAAPDAALPLPAALPTAQDGTLAAGAAAFRRCCSVARQPPPLGPRRQLC